MAAFAVRRESGGLRRKGRIVKAIALPLYLRSSEGTHVAIGALGAPLECRSAQNRVFFLR
jgi:hypothetical protein